MRIGLLLLVCCTIFSCKPKAGPAAKEASAHKTAVSTNCGFDNAVSSLGIGLVLATDTIELFNDSLLTERFTKAGVYSNVTATLVCSKFYKPDYGIVHFVCLDSTNTAYKILNGANDIKYLPRTPSYTFSSWENYLHHSMGIRLKEHQVVTKERGSNDILDLPKSANVFCPVKIRGDSLQVKYDCFYNNGNSKHSGEPCSTYIGDCKGQTTGWIRWRNDNTLLIDIFLFE